MGAPWALPAYHSIRQCRHLFDVDGYLSPNPGESDDRPSGRGPFDLLFGEVPSLWSETNSIYRTGFWPFEGLSGNSDSLWRVHASLETPFLAWSVLNAVENDEDLLLF